MEEGHLLNLVHHDTKSHNENSAACTVFPTRIEYGEQWLVKVAPKPSESSEELDDAKCDEYQCDNADQVKEVIVVIKQTMWVMSCCKAQSKS